MDVEKNKKSFETNYDTSSMKRITIGALVCETVPWLSRDSTVIPKIKIDVHEKKRKENYKRFSKRKT